MRKAIEKRMADRGLARLGHDVWVRGVKYRAHLIDQDVEDEAGYRREISISVLAENAQYFREGDSVVVDCQSYIVRVIRAPSTDDLLVQIGLKRA